MYILFQTNTTHNYLTAMTEFATIIIIHPYTYEVMPILDVIISHIIPIPDTKHGHAFCKYKIVSTTLQDHTQTSNKEVTIKCIHQMN